MRKILSDPRLKAASLLLGLLPLISSGYGQDQAQAQDQTRLRSQTQAKDQTQTPDSGSTDPGAGFRRAYSFQARRRLPLGLLTFKGSKDLYRSQVGLRRRAKALPWGAGHVRSPGQQRYFDRFQMRMNDWGGEPHTSSNVRVSKAGAYDLQFDYQNVQYFSSIPRFANPFFEQGNLQSQHIYRHSSAVLAFPAAVSPGQGYFSVHRIRSESAPRSGANDFEQRR